PNAGSGLVRLEERQQWDIKYADYLASLDKEKPVLATGDYNVAHKEIDLKNPKSNRRSAGFTDEEREGFTNLLARGFTDTFRYMHGDVEACILGGINARRLVKSTTQGGELTTG